MSDNINGIIIDGKVYTNNYQNGHCDDCDIQAECYNLWVQEVRSYCDVYGQVKRPFKFSQSLTDKLKRK